MAHWAASNALPNSTRKASPMVLISAALKRGKSEQLSVFFEQLERELVVALCRRPVAHHVGEHDGGQFALFGISDGTRH